MSGKEEINGRAPEISAILPVYNVAGYLDVCMESLTAQTFSDFEMILVDDGSTDGSGELCDLWARRDGRIRVIHKDNGGVSSARNRGIEEARGSYLAFVDPDDWLDPAYLEKLIRAAEGADADFAECDIWRYDDRTGKKIHRSCGGTMGVPWLPEEHMKYGATASYKSVSKRSLWTENGIRFPDCAFESPAVYALILAAAERTVNIPEPLYYYRRFRRGSLIETGYAGKGGEPNNSPGIGAMEHLLAEFRRLGLYERYRDVLEGVVKYRLSDILATQFYRKSPEDYRETESNFRSFLKKTFPRSHNERYITFGGYNLGRILAHMDILHDPGCRFTFSSLISLTDEGGSSESVHHRNRYRQIMLQREEDRAIWDIVRDVQPAFFFIDLLEERFDLIAREGRYVTASDAREGADHAEQSSGDGAPRGPGQEERILPSGPAEEAGGRRISRSGEQAAALFRERCGIFCSRIRREAPGVRFVVVENYLSGEYGTLKERRPFENAEEIRRTNQVLRACYAALLDVCPDAVRISPREEPSLEGLLFTDEKYEYGAVPEHLNEIANRRIAALITERLPSGDTAG